jgi:16S rRNA (guanine1207-N2)-methyltransferase
MLSLPSQLLMRNLDLFDNGQWAIVNPSDVHIFSEIESNNVVGLHQMFDMFQGASNIAKHKQYYAADFTAISALKENKLDGAVIYLPKAKQHLDLLIHQLNDLLKIGGQLLVVGENKAGIKSVGKLLEKLGSTVNKIDGAKHCGLICVTKENEASKAFNLESNGVIRTYSVNELPVKVFSLPGVFGHKQFDPGTQLLLSELAPKSDRLLALRGNILDFACGTGIIGTYLLKANSHVKLVMSDVSALATYCAKKTLELNEVEAQVIDSDGLDEVSGTFDAIVSNPPFHTGIKTNYDITQKFIVDAHKQTRPRGKLMIVANRFLPYADTLSKHYFKSQTVLQTNKFSIYEAAK